MLNLEKSPSPWEGEEALGSTLGSPEPVSLKNTACASQPMYMCGKQPKFCEQAAQGFRHTAYVWGLGSCYMSVKPL